MKDHQSHYYHKQQEQRQDWAIDRWCERKGITRWDLINHPCFSDITLLLSIQSEYEPEYKSNRTLYATYNALWSGVYSRKRGLNAKGLRRLETIVKTSEEIRQHNQKLVKRIQQLRTIK